MDTAKASLKSGYRFTCSSDIPVLAQVLILWGAIPTKPLTIVNKIYVRAEKYRREMAKRGRVNYPRFICQRNNAGNRNKQPLT